MMALVLGIDVTERRRLESKLRESEERYCKLVEMSPDAIALYSEKVEYINRAGLKLVGAIKPEEIVGKPVIDFLRPGYHKEVKQKVNEVRNGVPAPFAEEKMIRLDGSVIDVEIVGAPLTIKGKNSIQVVIRDLTERKKMEKELARLDMLNLVGQMAASIGHEIRNPMTAVRGFLQVLKEKKGLVDYGEYFDLMIEEMDRANCIISEYLSLARDKRIEKKKYNISKIIGKLLPLIRADAYETDKSIEYVKDEIPDLLVDEKEIRQLVLNLARNGLEAMPPGGKLTIKIYTEGDDVVLAVRDRGGGIKPENRAKIGTPFYTTKENGTGLGLAVCYSIAGRHNAVIDIETGSAGTTFYVRFRTGMSPYFRWSEM
ncbi:MAG: PAS domain S-box protein [Firmicutes bacterium]|nr:PAS domain S-box protein [Bacillota bacterium]